MTVGEALLRFRAEFNLSQKEIALTLGMVPQAYCRYEAGKYFPRANDLITLSLAYNVSTDYLLGLTDEPRPKTQEVRDKEFLERVEASVADLQKALEKAVANRGHLQDNEPAEREILCGSDTTAD